MIGGGPAGSATAITLARAGYTVAVLERSRYQAPRVGEMLPPAVRPLLAQLGVWERFQQEGFSVSPGTISVWGSDQPHEHDFIFSPHGNGWHVERVRFDAMLADSAEAAGAVVYGGARVRVCSNGHSNDWRVEAAWDGRHVRLQARFLVDTTGRARSALPFRTRHIGYDRLIGIATLLTLAPGEPGPDPRTLVEAVPEGWWYSAPLPDRHLALAYMSDADLVERARRRLTTFWSGCLDPAPFTRERVRRCLPATGLRIVAANSVRQSAVMGPDWLAVGDAAGSFDPLSAQGILKALFEGSLAAGAAAGALRGQTARLSVYAHAVEHGFTEYLRARSHYYAMESRWPDSVFWSRRSSSRPTGSGHP